MAQAQTLDKNNAEQRLASTNPSRNYEVLGTAEMTSRAQVLTIVENAKKAQTIWAALPLAQRIEYMGKIADHLEKNSEELARRMAMEMGMPIKMALAMARGTPASLRWYCDHAEKGLTPTVTYQDDKIINEIVYEPWGVFGCIVAWNFPVANFVVSTAQALLAGNTVVMKYSEEVILFGQFLERIIGEVGLPEYVINFVHGDGAVGGYLVEAPIDFLSFTGSSATGKKLYQKAAEKFIPATMELGGSSPGIVCADYPLSDENIHQIFWARFANSAQFCNNLKRLIVHESIKDELIEKLVAMAKAIKIGDAMNTETQMGPLVAERQVLQLEKQLADAQEKGALIHCGGKRPAQLSGAYFEPTILSQISKDMRVWTEETFGPLLPIISFETKEEALQLANDTAYGLNAYIYTDDKAVSDYLTKGIKAGTIKVNDVENFRPVNPFGGYKDSGMGRQGGAQGFHEVTQRKVVAREL